MKRSTKIAILLLACSGMLTLFAATADPGTGVTITVEIFSGRPNPTFSMNDVAAMNRLSGDFARLPAETPGSSQINAFTHLGYRGIVIDNPHGVNGIPRSVQVLDGVVLVLDTEDSAPRYLKDTGLEKRYLSLARDLGLIGELIEAGLVPDPATM